MSDKLTRIRLPGAKAFNGLMDWGECEPSLMVEQARSYAAHLRTQADEIEAAADSDFAVDVVRGTIVQHHIKNLQPGRATGEQP